MLIIIHLIGRLVFGAYFVHAGYNHFKNHAGLTGYAGSKKVPSASLAVYVSGLIALVAGALIISNVYTQVGYGLIVLFLIPVTFMMHNFWTQTDPASKANEKIAFLKNIALISASLMLM